MFQPPFGKKMMPAEQQARILGVLKTNISILPLSGGKDKEIVYHFRS